MLKVVKAKIDSSLKGTFFPMIKGDNGKWELADKRGYEVMMHAEEWIFDDIIVADVDAELERYAIGYRTGEAVELKGKAHRAFYEEFEPDTATYRVFVPVCEAAFWQRQGR